MRILRRMMFLACGLAGAAFPLWADPPRIGIHVLIDNLDCGGTFKLAVGSFNATAFSFGGAASSPSGVASASGREAKSISTKFDDAVVVKSFDKCTPSLFKLLAMSPEIRRVRIQWDKIDEPSYTIMKVTLMFSGVKSISYNATEENVAFDWRIAEICYSPLRADGLPDAPICFGWDRQFLEPAAAP